MLVAARRASAQTNTPPIRVRGLNHVTLSVPDVKRSVDFYQGLFGMPVTSRQGMTTNLQIGAGPQFLGVSAAGSNRPNINHLCLGVDNFNVDRIISILGQHGVTKNDAAAGNAGGGGLSGGPMRMRVRMRGPEAGGGRDGTPELYFSDPDGIVIQLQDPRYCGGAGALGNVCPKPEPSAKKGLLAVRGWSHCTIFGSGRKSALPNAVLANGTLVRVLDLNDYVVSADGDLGGHPSDNIPVALAAGELAGRRGRDVLASIIVGYELYARVRESLHGLDVEGPSRQRKALEEGDDLLQVGARVDQGAERHVAGDPGETIEIQQS